MCVFILHKDNQNRTDIYHSKPEGFFIAQRPTHPLI